MAGGEPAGTRRGLCPYASISKGIQMPQNTQNTTGNGSSGTGYLVPVECAVAYGQAGLSVLAASRKGKRPLAQGWENKMTHRYTEQQTRAEWKHYQPDALCIVCGAISGNPEVIDFDNGGELFRKWAVPLPQELYDRLLVEQSQSGGFHVAYRCKEQGIEATSWPPANSMAGRQR